jgi:hypothetical protein
LALEAINTACMGRRSRRPPARHTAKWMLRPGEEEEGVAAG